MSGWTHETERRARAALAKVTPGEWVTQQWGDFPPAGMPQESLARSVSAGDVEFILVAGENCVYDAHFIAEAPALLAAALYRIVELEHALSSVTDGRHRALDLPKETP